MQERIGYLPGEMQFYDNMTVERQLRFFSDMRDRQAEWSTVKQMAERLDLDLKPQIKNLSKGNKQKIGVIQALMHTPELLLLDEPTSGMSPDETVKMIRLLKVLGNRLTMILIEHNMNLVMSISSHITVLYQGSIIASGKPSDIAENPAVRKAYLGGHS